MASTPDDPTKAQVWITKGIDEMDFEFYFPQGPKGDPGGFVTPTAISAGTNLDEIVTPGHYINVSANGVAGPPNSGQGGHMEVLVGANYVLQRYTSISEPREVHVRQRFSNNLWQPWYSYSATRVDQSAGRTFYQWDSVNNRDQLIYGDTGWRLMAIPAINGHTTGGNVLFRRFGETVYMKLSSVQLEAGSGFATIITAANIPAGFRMISTERSMQAIGMSNNALDMQFLSCFGDVAWIRTINVSGTTLTTRPTSSTLSGTVSWVTDEVWPTTLPGTASGTIPNT